MEWVETTAKTVDEAKDAALDRLGVAADEAEFDIVEEPRPGLFGRLRGEARVRARVRPTQVRPKHDRRRRSRDRSKSKGQADTPSESHSPDSADAAPTESGTTVETLDGDAGPDETTPAEDAMPPRRSRRRGRRGGGSRPNQPTGSNDTTEEQDMTTDDTTAAPPESVVSPEEVGAAAVAFMEGLTTAFGSEASCELSVDGTELDVTVTGEGLGLLVGHGGRTLTAIQDLARVSSQRRLGDHQTRLRIDVEGYRQRRSEALSRFARDVAAQVRESGTPRSLEPMSSADRKVIHDALNDEEGVGSRSEGDDPNRRVVVVPA